MTNLPTLNSLEPIEHNYDAKKLHADFEDYLTRLGLRQTKQRRVILDAMLMVGAHADAETIGRQARQIDSSIGLATVYRTLQLMTEAGILAERNFTKDRSIFEIVGNDDEHHDHLICNQCGTIVEFFDAELEKLQETIAQRLGFKLKDHRMELFGDSISPDACARKHQPIKE